MKNIDYKFHRPYPDKLHVQYGKFGNKYTDERRFSFLECWALRDYMFWDLT